jgi:hypothetical protein
MSEITKLLDTYEDFEIAFLFKYKIDTYLPKTQNIIKSYIKDRRKIKHFYRQSKKHKFEDGKERCPRCKTDKIYSGKVEWTNINLYSVF